VGAWKIMPLGDSTTAAVCYRAKLWGKLTAAGKTNIDFVGTEKSTGCSDTLPVGFDQDNEGHSCYIVSNIIGLGNKPSCTNLDYAAAPSDLSLWFDNQMPDIVLMHFGTNDLWNGYGPSQILPAYKAIIDKIRTRNANVKLFVAQVIPLKPDTGKDYDALAHALNDAIPAWAATNSQPASPITVVDQFTGYVVATDNQADGVHPNSVGSDKIAQKWFDAIQGLL
jgi:lysophospholipase L1-like esterase